MLIDERARAFFDDFVVAFATFDGARIAERYLCPYLAFHSPGSARVFVSHAETDRYFQQIVDGYHTRGCRSCHYSELTVAPLGTGCALATVSWQLLADDGSVLGSWRESYNLAWVDDSYKVFASTDHLP